MSSRSKIGAWRIRRCLWQIAVAVFLLTGVSRVEGALADRSGFGQQFGHMLFEKAPPSPSPSPSPEPAFQDVAETVESGEGDMPFPDDEIVGPQTALNKLTAENEAIKGNVPQLKPVDSGTFNGGDMNRVSGAPNGDNFGRVTPSGLRRGLSPGGGMQNATNQLMQQAFQSMMKGKSPGMGSQSGQGSQVARQAAQKPAQAQPAKTIREAKTTPTPVGGQTPAARVTPETSPTAVASRTESPGPTPMAIGSSSADSAARSIEPVAAPSPTPRSAAAQWRVVTSPEKNPYRF